MPPYPHNVVDKNPELIYASWLSRQVSSLQSALMKNWFLWYGQSDGTKIKSPRPSGNEKLSKWKEERVQKELQIYIYFKIVETFFFPSK